MKNSTLRDGRTARVNGGRQGCGPTPQVLAGRSTSANDVASPDTDKKKKSRIREGRERGHRDHGLERRNWSDANIVELPGGKKKRRIREGREGANRTRGHAPVGYYESYKSDGARSNGGNSTDGADESSFVDENWDQPGAYNVPGIDANLTTMGEDGNSVRVSSELETTTEEYESIEVTAEDQSASIAELFDEEAGC